MGDGAFSTALSDKWALVSAPGAEYKAGDAISGGGVVRRWATNDGRELPALSGHSAWVADVAFLPDGSRLVSVGADQTLRVWDAADGRLLRTLRGHRIEVWCLAISADGQRVFSGGKDGELNAWDLRRPAPASGVLALPGKVRYWGFSADDGALVAVDDQGRVRRWDHARNPARTELFQVGPTRLGGTLSADGRWFAAGVRNGGLVVWNLRTGQRLVEIGSGTDFRVPVALLPATTNLITLQPKEHTYTRWSLPEGKAMETWPANPGFRGFNFAAAREPTSDSPGWFASVSSDGQADLRSLSAGKMSPVELGLRQITGVALDPAGHLLAVSSAAGRAAG
jgi:WD40 repeat protein